MESNEPRMSSAPTTNAPEGEKRPLPSVLRRNVASGTDAPVTRPESETSRRTIPLDAFSKFGTAAAARPIAPPSEAATSRPTVPLVQSAQPIARVALERVPVAAPEPAPVDTDLGWEDDEAPTEIAQSRPVPEPVAPAPEPSVTPDPVIASEPDPVAPDAAASTFGAGMLQGRTKRGRKTRPTPDSVAAEPSAPATTFGAGMLKGRKTRTPMPEPVTPEASAPSSSFGAGMLQSRKVRAKPSAPVALIEPTGASTFGAGMLAQRKSRAPFVMALLVAVAAIAVLVLSYR